MPEMAQEAAKKLTDYNNVGFTFSRYRPYVPAGAQGKQVPTVIQITALKRTVLWCPWSEKEEFTELPYSHTPTHAKFRFPNYPIRQAFMLRNSLPHEVLRRLSEYLGDRNALFFAWLPNTDFMPGSRFPCNAHGDMRNSMQHYFNGQKDHFLNFIASCTTTKNSR